MKRREISRRDEADARERARLRQEKLLADLQAREAERRAAPVPDQAPDASAGAPVTEDPPPETEASVTGDDE